MGNRKSYNVYSYETKKNGTLWRARYRTPSNRLIEKRGFPTKDAAERWLITERSKIVTGDWTDPRRSEVTIGALAPTWLALKAQSLKPSAYKPLESSWRIHVAPRWGDVPLKNIVNSDIAVWLSEINRSASIVHRAYGVLNGILKQAVKDGRILRNPAAAIDGLPRRHSLRHRRYLTPEQLHRVADAAGRHRAIVLTLGYCGLRWGEMIALRAEDIDLARRRIYVRRAAVEVHGEIHVTTPKTRAGHRPIPLPSVVSDALIAYGLERKDPDELVFQNSNGGYMRRVRSSEGTKSWWRTALRNAGLPNMVLHDLRHTAASIAVNAGGNVKAVQRMLGHASAAMTLDTYADLFDDGLDSLLDRIDATQPAPIRGKNVAETTMQTGPITQDQRNSAGLS